MANDGYETNVVSDVVRVMFQARTSLPSHNPEPASYWKSLYGVASQSDGDYVFLVSYPKNGFEISRMTETVEREQEDFEANVAAQQLRDSVFDGTLAFPFLLIGGAIFGFIWQCCIDRKDSEEDRGRIPHFAFGVKCAQ